MAHFRLLKYPRVFLKAVWVFAELAGSENLTLSVELGMNSELPNLYEGETYRSVLFMTLEHLWRVVS